jgi:hypothetical protein
VGKQREDIPFFALMAKQSCVGYVGKEQIYSTVLCSDEHVKMRKTTKGYTVLCTDDYICGISEQTKGRYTVLCTNACLQ